MTSPHPPSHPPAAAASPLPPLIDVLPLFREHVANFHRQRTLQSDPMAMNDEEVLRPLLINAAHAIAQLESARVQVRVDRWIRIEHKSLVDVYKDLHKLAPYRCDPLQLYRDSLQQRPSHQKRQAGAQQSTTSSAKAKSSNRSRASASVVRRRRKGRSPAPSRKAAAVAVASIEVGDDNNDDDESVNDDDSAASEASAGRGGGASSKSSSSSSAAGSNNKSSSASGDDSSTSTSSSPRPNPPPRKRSKAAHGRISATAPAAMTTATTTKTTTTTAAASAATTHDYSAAPAASAAETLLVAATDYVNTKSSRRVPDVPVHLPMSLEGLNDGHVCPVFAQQLAEALERGVRQDRAKGWRAIDLGFDLMHRRKNRTIEFKAMALRDYYALRKFLADDDALQAAANAESNGGKLSIPNRYQIRDESGAFVKRKKQFHPLTNSYLCYAWDVADQSIRKWHVLAQSRKEGLQRKGRNKARATLLGSVALVAASARARADATITAAATSVGEALVRESEFMMDSRFDPKTVYIQNHVKEMRKAFYESGGVVGASTEENDDNNDTRDNDSDDEARPAGSGRPRITNELIAEWKADANVHWTLRMSDDEKKVWIEKSEQLKADLPNVRERVLALIEEKPNASVRELTQKMEGAVHGNAVCRWLKHMRTCPYTNRVISPLRAVQRQKHLDYCRQLLNDNNGTSMTSSTTSPQKMLLVHFDDKCFFTTPPTTTAAVLRASTVRCESFGLEKVCHDVYHINHGKGKPLSRITVMSFVAMAYEGSVESGGVGIKLGMLRARKTSAENSDTMVDCRLSGTGDASSDGTLTFSLRELFESTVFPAVSDLVIPGCPYEGYRPVFQGDCAGPYGDEAFVAFARSECSCRGWVWEPHPSQMPHANANCIAIFPSLMKRHDALLERYGNGAARPHVDEIWQTCLEAFEAIEGSSVARAFVTARRIAAQVVQHGGDNSFLASDDQPSHIQRCRDNFQDTASGIVRVHNDVADDAAEPVEDSRYTV